MMSDANYFYGRIDDLICREQNGEGMAFSAFLTPEESAVAERYCQKRKVDYCLYGGYDQSERMVLAISSYDLDLLKTCFPITLLLIHSKELDHITHKDILGSLMASGIRRDQLGDIIVRDGGAMFFVLDHIKGYLIQNIKTIGHCGVELIEAMEDYSVPERQFEDVRFTAASLRLDAVVGGLCHFSRGQAEQAILNKMVSLNHITIEKKTKEIANGDRIVVRGKGKWIVDKCDALTKKGRVIVICRKYI